MATDNGHPTNAKHNSANADGPSEEEVRQIICLMRHLGAGYGGHLTDCNEAADLIERLAAQVDRAIDDYNEICADLMHCQGKQVRLERELAAAREKIEKRGDGELRNRAADFVDGTRSTAKFLDDWVDDLDKAEIGVAIKRLRECADMIERLASQLKTEQEDAQLAERDVDVCNESGPCSKYPNCPCPIGPPNAADGPSAEEVQDTLAMCRREAKRSTAYSWLLAVR